VANDGTAVTVDPGYRISARLERLPVAWWHTRMRLIVGSATFFDAFDAIAIAYVLPVLIPLWKLSPAEIGAMISIGYAGQALGSLFFGWLGERIGRIPTAVITIAIFSATSLGCAFAWSYQSLLVIRFLQGLGLGGETPVMHAYINEFAKAQGRARFTLVYQLPFPLGLHTAALAGWLIIPTLGWQWMFVIGAVPALLALVLRRLLPESPRWLASRGRFDEADRVLRGIESDIAARSGEKLPPVPDDVPPVPRAATRLGDLFTGMYLRRTLTLWSLWFCTYLVGYGLTGWLPSIYRTVYKLPVSDALRYSVISALIGTIGSIAVAFLIDKTGRKPWFTTALLLGSVPLFLLWNAGQMAPFDVVVRVSACLICINSVSISLGMFTAENYPAHLRAFGGGIAGAWLRVASMIGPLLVGFVLPSAGLGAVFAMFGVAAIVGGVICFLFAIETRGKVLETLTPTAASSSS
jgi:putative MFS transporter